MKWIILVVLALLLGGTFMYYSNTGKKIAGINAKITAIQNGEVETDDPDAAKQELDGQRGVIEGQRTLGGVLLTFLGAGFAGVLFAVFILPLMAQKFTQAIYDSGEMVEKDPMNDARALVAQGDYAGAIEAFKTAAAANPLNRMPWVEIAKIQRGHLKDPEAAIATLRSALESQEWELNDAAYFLFRLAELYDADRQDRATAAAIMQQVVDEFPDTRHSANARHKLHEWGYV